MGDIKHITPTEFYKLFPKEKINKNWEKSSKLTSIIRIKGTKRYRPIYRDSVGAYFLRGKNKTKIYM